MPAEKNTYDLLRLIFNLLIICLLIVIAYRVVEPFLFGFFWAVMVVIATWPLMIKLQPKLLNKRWLAVLVMTLVLSLVFIIPFTLIIISITKNGTYLIEWVKNLPNQPLPTLDWLSNVPIVGTELHQHWLDLIKNDVGDLVKEVQPYIGTMLSVSLEQVTNLGIFAFHGAVMIVFSALLYFNGENITKYIFLFAKKLSKQYGHLAIILSGQAIRAVALGVVVTAITLTFIGGISFVITAVPYPGIFTLLLFVCCVVQIGPLIVMIPAILWQFSNDNIASGIILVVIAVILTTLDSVMRAYLIKKGADLPFLLILFGVIGGILGFGVMGLFIGPVVLALAYKLLSLWTEEQDE